MKNSREPSANKPKLTSRGSALTAALRRIFQSWLRWISDNVAALHRRSHGRFYLFGSFLLLLFWPLLAALLALPALWAWP